MEYNVFFIPSSNFFSRIIQFQNLWICLNPLSRKILFIPKIKSNDKEIAKIAKKPMTIGAQM